MTLLDDMLALLPDNFTGAISAGDMRTIVTDLYNLASGVGGYQPLDSDLTAIAGLVATTDNFIQSKSSTWASRTPAQVAADLNSQIQLPSTSKVTGLDGALTGKAATVHTHTEADVTNLTSDLAAKAPLASPTFTGTVTLAREIKTPVTLSAAAANIATNAALGDAFRVTLGANGPYVLKAPTNPVDGQMAIWEITQDSTGGRGFSLETGVAGGFAFGTDIISITVTATASKTDVLGARYISGPNRWLVIAYAKGY